MKKKGFTLIELLVVIAIIALLMAILLPALARAREQGKRVVCLNDEKQIMVAWNMYCDENKDKIPGVYTTRCVCLGSGIFPCSNCNVNPIRPGGTDCNPAQIYHGSYPSWVETPHVWNTATEASAGSKSDPHYYNQWPDGATGLNGPFKDETWRHAIACGTLWKYLKDIKVYACPTGDKGAYVTYAGAELANGIHHTSGSWCSTGVRQNETRDWRTILSYRYRSQFRLPAHHLIYIDMGSVPGCNFNFRNDNDYLTNGCWMGASPPLRHGNGTNLAFADGHCEYIKWGKAAVTWAKNRALGGAVSCPPTWGSPTPCDPDLIYMAKITCGQLGNFIDDQYQPPAGCDWEKW